MPVLLLHGQLLQRAKPSPLWRRQLQSTAICGSDNGKLSEVIRCTLKSRHPPEGIPGLLRARFPNFRMPAPLSFRDCGQRWIKRAQKLPVTKANPVS